MSVIQEPGNHIIEKLVKGGDISSLNPTERVDYYNQLCNHLGLNPVTQPFQIITFRGGREQLYATKSCTEQLRKMYGVSITRLERDFHDGICMITATGQDGKGKVDVATGAVTISGLKGDDLCNAIMKAETKAKRRLTLSICGLGILDESEIETIPGKPEVRNVTDDNSSELNTAGNEYMKELDAAKKRGAIKDVLYENLKRKLVSLVKNNELERIKEGTKIFAEMEGLKPVSDEKKESAINIYNLIKINIESTSLTEIERTSILDKIDKLVEDYDNEALERIYHEEIKPKMGVII